ncbi:MAG: cold shock CspA family protein [Maribacter sp.]|jgi:cold shock CspA family protein
MILKQIKSLFKKNKDKIDGREETYYGKIVFVNSRKEYGFIESSDFEGNIFAHFKDCKTKVRKDKTVQFKIRDEEKGLKAIEVESLVQFSNDLNRLELWHT